MRAMDQRHRLRRRVHSSIWQTSIVPGPSRPSGTCSAVTAALAPDGDRDQILTARADHDRGAAGRPVDLAHEAEIDPVPPQQLERDRGKPVPADRSGKRHLGPGPAGGERLVRPLPAR